MRQFTVAILVASALAACAPRETPAPGAYGVQGGFVGAVVADEPQAALVGRDILQRGGTAADAAIAMYFTMAVTLPSQASLGGGGVCLSFNQQTNEAQALEFLARPPLSVPPGTERPTAVPGNVRGMFALHGIYGRLRWSQLLAPAENLARFGMPVSRALAADLAAVKDALMTEPQVRRVFAGPGGAVVADEGDPLVQPELASTIARIRTGGPAEFYSGNLAAEFAAGVAAAGGWVDRTDLADYQPVWRKPLTVGYDDRKAYFTPPPPAGGGIAGQLWAMLVKDNRWLDAAEGARDALLVETAQRTFADRRQWGEDSADPQNIVSSSRIEALLAQTETANPGSSVMPTQPIVENPAAATFIALDREGSVVACGVTLNSLFGTGRIAAGTGIVLASLPGQGGRGAAMLGPMIVVQPRGRQFVFAGAASGGVAAPTALANVAARTLLADESLDTAVDARRLHGGSDANFVYAEPGANAASLQILVNQRYEVVPTERLGHVNALLCPDGFQSSPELCDAVSDPRDFGLATTVD